MNLQEFPALTIKQPWAELILQGRKTLEIRNWSDPYRGPVWLHAAKTVDVMAMQHFDSKNLFYGGYVGVFELDAIVRLDEIRWKQWREQHLDSGKYVPGYFGLVIAKATRFREGLSGPGHLRLFYPNRVVQDELIALARNSDFSFADS